MELGRDYSSTKGADNHILFHPTKIYHPNDTIPPTPRSRCPTHARFKDD